MFSLGVSDFIMIAHHFDDPAFGPAQRMHGATFQVELEIKVHELDNHHVVMDIGLLRSILRQVLEGIDYRNLDDHPAFARVLSTTERVAEYIANETATRLKRTDSSKTPGPGASIKVLVRESPVAYAAYECSV